MQYISTRGLRTDKTFGDLIFEGFAEDGGLYVPEAYPKLPLETIASWKSLDYASLAFEVMHLFWPELERRELWTLCRDVFQPQFYPNGRDRISTTEVAPVTWLHDGVGLLELCNGPTLSFDDLSFPFLAKIWERRLGNLPEKLLLVGATTGDMGASCAAAFAKQKNVRIVLLSPKDRMSRFQGAQLYGIKAKNVTNLVVDGTFDHCQDMVSAMLKDKAFAEANNLGASNATLFSRIAVQIVYYFWAYLRAVEQVGDDVVFAVPAGNFGNAFAGLLAQRMGLPILRLIVSTNENDALDAFLRTGTYAPRKSEETIATSSPSTDISRAANFERFLFEILNRNASRVKELMADLEEKGSLTLTPEEFALVRRTRISSGTSNHANRLEIIETMNLEYDTLVDPHTADTLYSGIYLHPVGVPTICLETVHAVKFPKIIRQATGLDVPVPEGFEGVLSQQPINAHPVADDAAAVRQLVQAEGAKL